MESEQALHTAKGAYIDRGFSGNLRFLMNQLVRTLVGPFASAVTGAVIAIFAAVFFLSIEDKNIINGFAIFGAILGVAPVVLRMMVGVVRYWHRLRGKALRKVEAAPVAPTDSAKKQRELEHDGRQRLLAAEHEARRPVCSHCGRKTEPVFRYRKADGRPDMRYRDNPLLCNKCFRPYSGVRPWKLPNT